MVRTGQAAVDYAEARVGDTMPDSGLCLQFTRQNFAVNSLYYSAIDAWNGAASKHKGDRNPPLAVPVWFDGDPVYGHVAFHCKNGRVISTYNDDIRAYSSISAAENAFGYYMGWAEEINEVRIWSPPAPEPPDLEVVGDMFVTAYGGSAFRLVSGGHIVGISEDTYNKLRSAGVPAVALSNSQVEHLQDVLIGEDWKVNGHVQQVKTV